MLIESGAEDKSLPTKGEAEAVLGGLKAAVGLGLLLF
jgi:hypothetical protein